MNIKDFCVKNLVEFSELIHEEIRRKKIRISSCFDTKSKSLLKSGSSYKLNHFNEECIFLSITLENKEILYIRIFNISNFPFPIHLIFDSENKHYEFEFDFNFKIRMYYEIEEQNHMRCIFEERVKYIVPVVKDVIDRKLLYFYKVFTETNIIETLDTIYLIRKYRSSQLSRLNKDEFSLLTKTIYDSHFEGFF